MSCSPAVSHVRRPEGLPSPLGSGARIRAVLFDLDGTLYDQPRMRRLMVRELLTDLICRPRSATRRLRGLREFRRAQEALRHATAGEGRLDRAQLALAATRAAVPAEELELLVREWMEERPLKHLARCGYSGLGALFAFLASSDVQVGVFSDYPPVAKLRALGVAEHCSLMLCASDVEIAAFKPNPRGFLVACERWGLAPHEVLMVGDRADVDGAGASAAGMPCVILGRPSSSALHNRDVVVLPSLERLHRALDDHR